MATRKSKSSGQRKRAATKQRRSEPQDPYAILQRSDLQTILQDLAMQIAPDDVAQLVDREPEVRRKSAALEGEHLELFRRQIELAIDCLGDHVAGDCPQVPYFTVSLLAAALSYFLETLDVIPDFLPRIGALDDAAVMEMACEFGEDGLRRYCDWKGRDAATVLRKGHAAEAAGV